MEGEAWKERGDWHYPGRRNEWRGLQGNCVVVNVHLAMDERNQRDIDTLVLFKHK